MLCPAFSYHELNQLPQEQPMSTCHCCSLSPHNLWCLHTNHWWCLKVRSVARTVDLLHMCCGYIERQVLLLGDSQKKEQAERQQFFLIWPMATAARKTSWKICRKNSGLDWNPDNKKFSSFNYSKFLSKSS